MVTNENIAEVVGILRREVRAWREPVTERSVKAKRDPFRVLIGCLLSLRTKDEVTDGASERLFALADTPGAMLRLRTKTIEKAIFPVGFYRNKAKQIRGICRVLIAEYEGRVPDTIDELVKLKGVGRKTANLVVTRGHDKQGICVDIHVHRITNRWGYVKTGTPDETESALREKLPGRYWKSINGLLVAYGQNLCRPVSPFCSRCKLADVCGQNGVTTRR
ncbi:MAG: endonuclease III [Candidatus Eisenbacteria bacterium]